jgi:hypothetical protein
MEPSTEQKLLAESLIAAAARHDLSAVKNLLRDIPANVQDPETRATRLCTRLSQDAALPK